MTLPISKFKIGTIVRTMEQIDLYTTRDKTKGPSAIIPQYCLGSVAYKSEGAIGVIWIWTTKEGKHKWNCIEVMPHLESIVIEREI